MDQQSRRRAEAMVAVPWALVLFPLLDTGSAAAFALGLVGTLTVFEVSYGPAGALLPELFQTRFLYTGAGMAYNLAGVIGGGTAPILATSLAADHGSGAVGLVLAAFAGFSLLCSFALPETRQRMLGDDPSRRAPPSPASAPSSPPDTLLAGGFGLTPRPGGRDTSG